MGCAVAYSVHILKKCIPKADEGIQTEILKDSLSESWSGMDDSSGTLVVNTPDNHRNERSPMLYRRDANKGHHVSC